MVKKTTQVVIVTEQFWRYNIVDNVWEEAGYEDSHLRR